jgi:cbb3-type cytochrome oxidase maturation protein
MPPALRADRVPLPPTLAQPRRRSRRMSPWRRPDMDILYLLIPLSVVLVLFVLAGLWWAVYRGQFENVDQEGERILKDG